MFGIVIFFAVIAVVSAQCHDGEQVGKPTEEAEQAACGWYAADDGDSCCPSFAQVFPFFAASQGLSTQYGYKCSEKLTLLYCAACSPTFGIIPAGTGNVCVDFVTDLWQACKHVNGFCLTSDGIIDETPTKDVGCPSIASAGFKAYAGGDYQMRDFFNVSTFYEQFLFPEFGSTAGQARWQILDASSYAELSNPDQQQNCFNSGSAATVSTVLVAAVALLQLFLF